MGFGTRRLLKCVGRDQAEEQEAHKAALGTCSAPAKDSPVASTTLPATKLEKIPSACVSSTHCSLNPLSLEKENRCRNSTDWGPKKPQANSSGQATLPAQQAPEGHHESSPANLPPLQWEANLYWQTKCSSLGGVNRPFPEICQLPGTSPLLAGGILLLPQ